MWFNESLTKGALISFTEFCCGQSARPLKIKVLSSHDLNCINPRSQFTDFGYNELQVTHWIKQDIFKLKDWNIILLEVLKRLLKCLIFLKNLIFVLFTTYNKIYLYRGRCYCSEVALSLLTRLHGVFNCLSVKSQLCLWRFYKMALEEFDEKCLSSYWDVWLWCLGKSEHSLRH